MIHVSSELEFENEIKEGLVLVDFYANWCGPCKMLSPVLDEVEKESNIKVVKVDTDELVDLAEKFNVMSIPNLVFFKNGEPVKQIVGFQPKANILSVINSL